MLLLNGCIFLDSYRFIFKSSCLHVTAGPALGMFEVFGRTGPPTLGGRHYGSADQRTINAATRCVLRAHNAAKCVCGLGSAPDPAGGAYSAPPDPLAGFKGPLRGWVGKGKGGNGNGGEEKGERDSEGGEGRRRRGELDSDTQLEQDRRLTKAGPV